jgi:hypothetical protein
MKKKILLITNIFPPDSDVQAWRMHERCVYLSCNGWDVTVICPFRVENAKLYGSEALFNYKVYRVKPLLYKLFPSFDYWNYSFYKLIKPVGFLIGYIRWIPAAILKSFLVSDKETTLYTINNPITLHIVGFFTRKKFKNWIAEFRDPIVGYEFSHREKLGKIFDKFFENLLVQKASTLVFRKGIQVGLSDFQKRYPESKLKFFQLPDYGVNLSRIERATKNNQNNSELIGVFAGNFYGESSPKNLIYAIENIQERFKLNFYGKEIPFEDSDFAIYHGAVPFDSIVDAYTECHFSIIYDLANYQGSVDNFIPSKISELIAIKKPILFIGDKNSLSAKLISENKIGTVCSDSLLELSNALLSISAMIKDKTFNQDYFESVKQEISQENGEKCFEQVLNGEYN